MDQAAEANVAYLMFIGIIGMLLLSVAFILFFVIYQRRLLAQQEHLQRLELTHQKESLELFVQAQEEERKRIAQDLHDGVGALLSASKLYVNKLPGLDQDQKVGFIRQEAGSLIDETIENIRSITRNLLPNSLERFGLFAAIEDLANRINKLGTLEFEFEYNHDIRFNIQQEFNLFRIIQELSNNTMKYAQASRIDLSITIVEHQLTMSYRDDGLGFSLAENTDRRARAKGLGLRGIKSRAQILDAKLSMNSSLGHGFLTNLEMIINLTES